MRGSFQEGKVGYLLLKSDGAETTTVVVLLHIAQIQHRKHVLAYADYAHYAHYTPLALQREPLIDHAGQESVCPERSRS